MGAPQQPDLLSWEPPQTALAFDEREVRGSTQSARIARAIAVALKECGKPRRQVARAMSEYLGEPVSEAMLDAYASVARETHRMSVERYLALVHATGDRRLLELLAQPQGWAVIQRCHLPLIDAAILRDREEALRKQRKQLLRRSRAEGGL